MTMSHPDYASADHLTRHVFIRNLVLYADIGVYPAEHGRQQRIRLNLDLAVQDEGAKATSAIGRDHLARVVDYGAVADTARAIVASGHVKLVETLAERIAQAALTDPRILRIRVRVEKLDVFPDMESVGIEIERIAP
jgi:dihydroneopterin aldolase